MKFNRKNMTVGIAGLGLVGALVSGGVFAAQAATGAGEIPQPLSMTSSTVGDRQSGHMVGMVFGQSSPMTAVVSYLGLSQTELQDRLQSGKSVADIANAQGKSVSGLEDAMVSELKTNLDSNSTLSADEKVAAVEQMTNYLDMMLNATHTPGEGMGMGSSLGMGMHAGAGAGSGSGMGMATTTATL